MSDVCTQTMQLATTVYNNTDDETQLLKMQKYMKRNENHLFNQVCSKYLANGIFVDKPRCFMQTAI